MLLSFLLWLSCSSNLYGDTLPSQEQNQINQEQQHLNLKELQSNQDELQSNEDELESNNTLDACKFEDLPLHNEMTHFIGQLVLKLVQTTLTTGSGYIKELIKTLDIQAARNQVLQRRLQLYVQQTEEIDKSPLLLLTDLDSPADLSVLMHFFDDRVPLQTSSTAVLPKLARLYENVLSALITNPYKPTPEDQLIEKTLIRNGLPLMNSQLATVLDKFVKDYHNRQHSSDKEFTPLPQNSTCEAETKYLNIYNFLQEPNFELIRLAKIMLITAVVLNQIK